MKFVNVYFVNRYYGGPEEGGWWYNAGEVEECVPCRNEAFARKVKENFEKGEYSNEGRRPLWSVTCGGVYEVRIEDKPGENYPQERPIYE